jgi:hypothetical protein
MTLLIKNTLKNFAENLAVSDILLNTHTHTHTHTIPPLNPTHPLQEH